MFISAHWVGDSAYIGNWLDADTVLGDTASTPNIGTWTVVSAQPPVPVPASVWLFGSALAGLGFVGRKKKTRNYSAP
ncbi:MAG: VPLPA-CTERM sorting domain-containing protein [Sedimenticola sp.]